MSTLHHNNIQSKKLGLPTSQSGSALIMAIVALMIVAGIGAAVGQLLPGKGVVSSDHLKSAQALYAAESARIAGEAVCEDLDVAGCEKDDDGNAFKGWVGDSWGDAVARHKIDTSGAGSGPQEGSAQDLRNESLAMGQLTNKINDVGGGSGVILNDNSRKGGGPSIPSGHIDKHEVPIIIYDDNLILSGGGGKDFAPEYCVEGDIEINQAKHLGFEEQSYLTGDLKETKGEGKTIDPEDYPANLSQEDGDYCTNKIVDSDWGYAR